MILFVFVDGVGAGPRDARTNPLAAVPGILSWFRREGEVETEGHGPLPPGTCGRLIDATLGVPGRPQSATGQAALLTGVNAPAWLGGHRLGFPGAHLCALLEEDNVLLSLAARGRRVAFLNAYPSAYLRAAGLPHDPSEHPEPALEIPRRLARKSVTTVAAEAAGLKLRTFGDLHAGRALYHDFSALSARARRLGVPALSPEAAADRLLAAARPYDLVLFEYFLTDKAGHARDWDLACRIVAHLDRFLCRLIARLAPDEDALIVTSDHGNLEDLTRRTHTANPVPLVAWGRATDHLQRVHDLTGVRGLLETLCLP